MNVFISYAHEDKKIAKKVYDDLTNQGISCWIDNKELLIGQMWEQEISCNIEKCSHFLLLISNKALSRNSFVLEEVKIALDAYDKMSNSRIFFMPVSLDDCKSQAEKKDKRLEKFHWGDLSKDYSSGLTLILKTLKESQKTTNIKTWIEHPTDMEFVWVEGGSFTMGDNIDDETPAHKVTIDAFWIARYPVTVFQFKEFIKATNYQTDAEKKGWAYGWPKGLYKKTPFKEQKGHCWKKMHFTQDDHHPVVNISWNDAIALTKWLSEKGKDQFRLPSEAEWEFACRARTQTPFYFGNTISMGQANFNGKPALHNGTFVKYREQTTPVGEFTENKFGLFDMHGNVWEWCADTYAKDAYRKHERKNPICLEANESARVIRGGCWNSFESSVRSASRSSQKRSYCDCTIGARLLRTI